MKISLVTMNNGFEMNEEMIHFLEKKPELVAVHQDADSIALDNQGATSPLPYHPGARKYFEERGVKFK